MLNSTQTASGGNTMFFKSFAKAMLLFALIFSLCGIANAQDRVIVYLKPPPPNKLTVGDLWNLELNNTTDKPIRIYLTGRVSEQKDGQVIDGKSKVFVVNPGKKSYTYKDFQNAEVKYSNSKYKEIILRTGNAPEGEYTICVNAFTETEEIAGQENCIEQTVRQEGSVSLISPSDGEEIAPGSPLVFTWVPIGGGTQTSRMRVWQLMEGQNGTEIIKKTRPVFDKDGIKSASYQYALTDPKLEEGKKYIWTVKTGETESEPFTFKIPKPVDTIKSQFHIVITIKFGRKKKDCNEKGICDIKIEIGFNMIPGKAGVEGEALAIEFMEELPGKPASLPIDEDIVLPDYMSAALGYSALTALAGDYDVNYSKGKFGTVAIKLKRL
jgi:hypothetical protein